MSSVINELVTQIKSAAVYNANAQQAPAAILWTDKERQWEPALPMLLDSLPELFVLGDYQPKTRTGPAIWLKCVIAKQLDDHDIPDGVVPIIYLPGVSRLDLRVIEQCPEWLQPLAELQYRGAMWSQYNGKDWTLNAFLTSGAGGLGLDVARDQATQEAMLRALEVLLGTRIEVLENKKLEAADFNQLLINDPIRDLLSWMSSPEQARQLWSEGRWRALCDEAKNAFDLDIERDGEYAAAEKLCARNSNWEIVWQRFLDSPDLFPVIPELLQRVPLPDLLADPATYPQANLKDETELLSELQKVAGLSSDAARKKLEKLDKTHAKRRDSIWARLGKAPWTTLLEPMVEVARTSQSAVGGLSPQELGDRYVQDGWKVDAAAIRALAACETKQQLTVVADILETIYTPWLADLNERFQKQVKEKGYPGVGGVEEAIAEYEVAGEAIFFVDGLRFDVAHQLIALLRPSVVNINLSTQWAALPSVTATAKAAVSPINKLLTGTGEESEFEPSLKEGGVLTHDRFKRQLVKLGWQHLADDETGDPALNAWVACGDIDKEGHISELKLPRRMKPILDSIAERVNELLLAGWRKIRIVTDHGWLLVPGQMPKSALPAQATESRWGRCAKLKQNVAVDGLNMGWYWNPNVSIHFPYGIHSFIAGRCYGHGGVSLQECLVPVITIEGEAKKSVSASMAGVRWVGLTCRVEVKSKAKDLTVDLRTKLADETTSLVKPKKLQDGKTSLMVLDDENEGTTAMVVIIDNEGNILAKQATTVGGES